MFRIIFQKLAFTGLLLAAACSPTTALPTQTATPDLAIQPTSPAVAQAHDTPTAAPEPAADPTAQALADNGIPAGLEPFPEPNPVHLDLTLDEENRTSAEIGYEGGNLSLTTADGTVFTLTVPPEALFSPETVSMVSVKAVSGLPMENSQAAAVQLEPEGLYFFRPAVLIIQPPAGQVDNLAGFGTFDDGQDFHLLPSTAEGSSMQIAITHFSSYGVIEARADEIERIRERYTPSAAEAIAKDNMLSAMNVTSEQEALADALEESLNQWFYYSVMVRLRNAANNDNFIDAAVGEYISWKEFTLVAYALIEPPAGEDFLERFNDNNHVALDTMAVMLKNAFDRAHIRCVRDNDPLEALKMVRWGLLASHFELWGREGFAEQTAQGKFRQCFNFEFVFRSRVEGQENDTDWTAQVAARMPLEIRDFDYYGGLIASSGDLEVEIFEFSPLPSQCTPVGRKGTLTVVVQVDLNFKNTQAKVEAINILMDVPLSQRPRLQVTCSAGLTQDVPAWWPWYVTAMKEFIYAGTVFLIPLPVYASPRGDIFAEIDLSGPVPEEPNVTEDSTYQLVHKPQP